MRFYLDASAVVPLILRDAHTERMTDWIAEEPGDILVSDFAALELSSVVSRQVRMGALSDEDGRKAIDLYEEWSHASTTQTSIGSADMALAENMVRDFATKLAAADSLHLAASINLGATLVTFDQRLAQAAKGRGANVVTPE
jgi:predicted nucleic acid-binding protein